MALSLSRYICALCLRGSRYEALLPVESLLPTGRAVQAPAILRLCYAVSGTDIGKAATHLLSVSNTDIGYAATHLLRGVKY
eukprot:979019-Rhodomonas_salina.1